MKIVTVFFLACGYLICQWQPDVRLTNDPAVSEAHLNNIASSGDNVHVVWHDLRTGSSEIYYKRSTDGGISWSGDIRLTNAPGLSRIPAISVYEDNVYVVWEDQRDGGDTEIYYKLSTNRGTSWGGDIRLTNDPASSSIPRITVTGQTGHIVWVDRRDGNDEIYYKRTVNGGSTWGADTRLTNDTSVSDRSNINTSGSIVHVTWDDTRHGNREIFYKRSTDGGLNWSADTRLTNNSFSSTLPFITSSSDDVHIVWYDNRDGNSEIYYKRSQNGGISWNADIRLTNNTAFSGVATTAVFDKALHVVWNDERDGNYEIYYKLSTDGGNSWGIDTRLTNNPSYSEFAFLTISGRALHLAWRDYRDGNSEIYYKRNPTGNPIGIINISSEIPQQFLLTQNYPNPFNPVTKIEFSVPDSEKIKLTVYDIQGRELEVLADQYLAAGVYKAEWDASMYSSGVYFYRIQAGGFTDLKKMILVK